MEIHLDRFFSEPSGWETARVSLLGSLAFFGLYGFFELLGGGGSLGMLVIGTAAGLSGIAELLPKRRQLWVNAFRVAAVGILLALVVWSLYSLLAN